MIHRAKANIIHLCIRLNITRFSRGAEHLCKMQFLPLVRQVNIVVGMIEFFPLKDGAH